MGEREINPKHKEVNLAQRIGPVCDLHQFYDKNDNQDLFQEVQRIKSLEFDYIKFQLLN